MNSFIKKKLNTLPDRPGVYLMKDESGGVIYVGKARSLRSRVRSYFTKAGSLDSKTVILVSKISDLDWIVTDTEVEALMLECNLIKQFNPRYNIKLVDDKHYPYLCVSTSETFPRAFLVRRVKQDGNKYYGPYASASTVTESLRLMRRIFRIRGCKKPLRGGECDKPCLNHHLGQCDSPCSGGITAEEYSEMVNTACSFLEGRLTFLIEQLKAKMDEASDEMRYERAGRLRDQMIAISRLDERQKAINTEDVEYDVLSIGFDGHLGCVQVLFIRSGKLIGQEHFFLKGADEDAPEEALGEFMKQFYKDSGYIPAEILLSHMPPDADVIQEWLTIKRSKKARLICPQRGAKKRLVEMAASNAAMSAQRETGIQAQDENESALDLEELREVLGLAEIPKRIEAYDISNIQGKEAVGSMVVFKDGRAAKSLYRRFKIRSGDTPDDYAMMREVILRRAARSREGDKKFTDPDLMLIDGGKGQLGAAVGALEEAEMSFTVISIAKRLEEVFTRPDGEPIILPRDSRALRLLQRLRDEAHRFALDYHRKLRSKKSTKSVLDGIPGIGSVRRKALIKRFGSVAGVRKASLEEFLAVPGMTRATAEAVCEALNPGSI